MYGRQRLASSSHAAGSRPSLHQRSTENRDVLMPRLTKIFMAVVIVTGCGGGKTMPCLAAQPVQTRKFSGGIIISAGFLPHCPHWTLTNCEAQCGLGVNCFFILQSPPSSRRCQAFALQGYTTQCHHFERNDSMSSRLVHRLPFFFSFSLPAAQVFPPAMRSTRN